MQGKSSGDRSTGEKPKKSAKGAGAPPRRKGMIVVLSGASGSGKTTLARRLLELVPGLEKSTSFTTRPPRPDENPGVAYHFVDEPAFRDMIKRKAFVEWAKVHRDLYGTSAEQIESRIQAGIDIVCDIDVQGGAAIRGRFPDDSVLVFVLPPSWGELERRLRGRATDSDKVIQERLERAREEHRRATTYDYLVVNDDFSACSAAVADIVRTERLRTERAKHLLPEDLLEPPPTPPAKR